MGDRKVPEVHMKEFESERRVTEILEVLSESERPVGARVIARELEKAGIFIGERAVRYHLRVLDERGLTENHGYYGRTITTKGLEEQENAIVYDRVGFVTSKIENLTYGTTFDPARMKGEIIVNMSYIPKERLQEALELVREVFRAGYMVSPYIKVLEEGEMEALPVPKGMMGLATTCSITIDGVLLKAGIPSDPRYGGIAQVRGHRLTRFTDLIAYEGSSLDPLEIFLARGMTSVMEAVKTGSGKVLANFREIPVAAKPRVLEVMEVLKKVGFGRALEVGEVNRPLLSVPVGKGRFGVAIAGGMNALAAVEEWGIPTETKAITALLDIREMEKLA